MREVVISSMPIVTVAADAAQLQTLLLQVQPHLIIITYTKLLMVDNQIMEQRNKKNTLVTPGHRTNTNAEMIQAMRLDVKLGMEMNTKVRLKALKRAKICASKGKMSVLVCNITL